MPELRHPLLQAADLCRARRSARTQVQWNCVQGAAENDEYPCLRGETVRQRNACYGPTMSKSAVILQGAGDFGVTSAHAPRAKPFRANRGVPHVAALANPANSIHHASVHRRKCNGLVRKVPLASGAMCEGLSGSGPCNQVRALMCAARLAKCRSDGDALEA